MTPTLNSPRRPRNPFAKLARARAAGPHRGSPHRERQAGQRELRQALTDSACGRSP